MENVKRILHVLNCFSSIFIEGGGFVMGDPYLVIYKTMSAVLVLVHYLT